MASSPDKQSSKKTSGDLPNLSQNTSGSLAILGEKVAATDAAYALHRLKTYKAMLQCLSVILEFLIQIRIDAGNGISGRNDTLILSHIQILQSLTPSSKEEVRRFIFSFDIDHRSQPYTMGATKLLLSLQNILPRLRALADVLVLRKAKWQDVAIATIDHLEKSITLTISELEELIALGSKSAISKIERHAPERIQAEPKTSTPSPLENSPILAHTHNRLYSDRSERRPLDVVITSEQLHDLLQGRCGMAPGVLLTETQLKLASETAFNAVIAGVIANPGTFRDPVTGLEFPPKPREVDFQSRGRNAKGRRMTYDEYLADKAQGWGDYTQHHLLTSSWLNDLDRPLYMALIYQANKEADEAGVPDTPSERTAAHDQWFLRHGILTPGHLEHAPEDYETQSKTLLFATKLALELPKGRRPRTSADR